MTVEKVEQIRAFEGCVVPAVVYRADDTPCSRHAGVGKRLRVLGQVGPKGGLDTTLRTLAVGSKSIGLKKTGRLGGPDINVDKRI